MLWPFGLEARRRRLHRRAPAGPLRDFLAQPFPSPKLDWRETPFLALDLETTGGDAARDEIVSFGWVCIERQRIRLDTARHRVVRLSGAMSAQSAVVHHITDDEAAAGAPLEDVLAELLGALAGRVLIAHYAPTELGFVAAACRRVYGAELITPVVDTLELAGAAIRREHRPPRRGELRLASLRAHHGLPRYRLHNALSDALAAAELFLAQACERGEGLALKRLMR